MASSRMKLHDSAVAIDATCTVRRLLSDCYRVDNVTVKPVVVVKQQEITTEKRLLVRVAHTGK